MKQIWVLRHESKIKNMANSILLGLKDGEEE